ncbi:hypothetical protein WJX72_008077 [[Myrmecia] bisecta]|uniref:DUF559 domain-containing protein n=1 Tax=[Myrmecia] bisecta TaxID=41462 RepID=A0AAW1QBV8_9CHLO
MLCNGRVSAGQARGVQKKATSSPLQQCLELLSGVEQKWPRWAGVGCRLTDEASLSFAPSPEAAARTLHLVARMAVRTPAAQRAALALDRRVLGLVEALRVVPPRSLASGEPTGLPTVPVQIGVREAHCAHIVWSLAVLGGSDQFAAEVEAVLQGCDWMARSGAVQRFTAEQLCSSVWALAVLQQTDSPSFQMIWAELWSRQWVPSRSARRMFLQIHQAALSVRLEGASQLPAASEWPPVLGQAQRVWAQEASSRRIRQGSYLQREIARALLGLGAQFTQEAVAGEYSVDFALTDPQGRLVVLEADGPSHFARAGSEQQITHQFIDSPRQAGGRPV